MLNRLHTYHTYLYIVDIRTAIKASSGILGGFLPSCVGEELLREPPRQALIFPWKGHHKWSSSIPLARLCLREGPRNHQKLDEIQARRDRSNMLLSSSEHSSAHLSSTRVRMSSRCQTHTRFFERFVWRGSTESAASKKTHAAYHSWPTSALTMPNATPLPCSFDRKHAL